MRSTALDLMDGVNSRLLDLVRLVLFQVRDVEDGKPASIEKNKKTKPS